MITLSLLACIDVTLVKQDEEDPAFDSGDAVTVDTETTTTSTTDTGDSVTVVDTGDTVDTGTTDTAVDTVDTAPVETADTAPDEPTPIDVSGVCTGGYPYTSWFDTAATEPELHVVGVYESQNGPGGEVEVKVTRTAESTLVLTSYSAVDWQIDLDAAHDVTEILISSYDLSTYTFTGAGTAPVVYVGWIGACAYEIPDTDPYSGCETPDLQAIVEPRTGLKMASFQGCYSGGEYTIRD
jgi:hypothetical protein